PEIIHQAIWLYLRFALSFRDVEDLLAERGIAVSYETVRRWVNHFGPTIAARLRKRIAGGRAFHNRRSGKLETDPARRPPATLARMGPPKPQVCTPETLKQTGSWPLSNVSPPPSPPSSCVK